MSKQGATISTTGMAQTLITYQTSANYGVIVPGDVESSSNDVPKTTYTTGTGANQIQRASVGRYTLTPASGTLDIDLTALFDANNIAWSAQKIRELYVYNTEPATGANLKVGGAGTNAWTAPFAGSTTNQVTVGPTDEFRLSSKLAGFTVDSTHKILRFTHDGSSSGNIVFDLWLLGW